MTMKILNVGSNGFFERAFKAKSALLTQAFLYLVIVVLIEMRIIETINTLLLLIIFLLQTIVLIIFFIKGKNEEK